MGVPPSALAPKPATTTTITRGGFGESVAKQHRLACSVKVPQRLLSVLWEVDSDNKDAHH